MRELHSMTPPEIIQCNCTCENCTFTLHVYNSTTMHRTIVQFYVLFYDNRPKIGFLPKLFRYCDYRLHQRPFKKYSRAVLLAGFVLVKDHHISQNKEQKYGIFPSNKEHLVKFLHATQLVTCHKSALQLQKIFKIKKI